MIPPLRNQEFVTPLACHSIDQRLAKRKWACLNQPLRCHMKQKHQHRLCPSSCEQLQQAILDTTYSHGALPATPNREKAGAVGMASSGTSDWEKVAWGSHTKGQAHTQRLKGRIAIQQWEESCSERPVRAIGSHPALGVSTPGRLVCYV